MKRWMIISVMAPALLNLPDDVFAQMPVGGYTVAARVMDGDTILYVHLPAVNVLEQRRFTNEKEYLRYYKLRRDVRKAYPYAKVAGEKMKEYAGLLKDVTNDRKKRRLMKQAEEELRAEFEGDIRKLTFTQGRILIKLIDRETGDTSYEVIKELRGSFSAFFWQSVARIFGSNLKSEYDAAGDDRMIEQIVQAIEAGEI